MKEKCPERSAVAADTIIAVVMSEPLLIALRFLGLLNRTAQVHAPALSEQPFTTSLIFRVSRRKRSQSLPLSVSCCLQEDRLLACIYITYCCRLRGRREICDNIHISMGYLLLWVGRRRRRKNVSESPFYWCESSYRGNITGGIMLCSLVKKDQLRIG